MKDLNKLAIECMENLESIGITTGIIKEFKINSRAKKRWGRCTKEPDGSYIIEISSRLLTDDVENGGAINTIYHELLHSCPGCMSHTGKWKRLAERVKSAYGYDIKRTSTSEEKGVPNIPVERIRTIRYRFVCCGCGAHINRQRMSDLVRHPEYYRCVKCHGRIEREYIK